MCVMPVLEQRTVHPSRSRGADATNLDVVSTINAGVQVVNYRGHGESGIWQQWNEAGEDFGQTEVDLLYNGGKTPVCFGICCLNNNLGATGMCLGEIFTQPDDAAVAYLGASDCSITDPNDTYDKMLFSTFYDYTGYSIGMMFNAAAVKIINDHA